MSLILFYALAGLILLFALFVITSRNIFHSALSLVAVFFLVAGIYLMLNAEFLAAVQVLIYVGAITILILFAIMLTHRIYSKSVRQTNEQVVPAFVIVALFLVIGVISLQRTFGDARPAPNNIGSWTASINTSDLPPEVKNWSWEAVIADSTDHDYRAVGSFSIIEYDSDVKIHARSAPAIQSESGNIISANSGFSSINKIFMEGQTVYLKIWNDGVDYNAVSEAVWRIYPARRRNLDDSGWSLLKETTDPDQISVPLANSNTETIGRLLMSRFVLPFEVVSILLLAALIGAIVIARKDS